MNFNITKVVLKRKINFKVKLMAGTKNCEVRQFSHEEIVPGIISDNNKEIQLLKPLKYNFNNKDKEVTTLKIPKETLVSVMEEMIKN